MLGRGLLADHECLYGDGNQEPDEADGEEPNEPRAVCVAVGEKGGEITSVAVKADEDDSLRREC